MNKLALVAAAAMSLALAAPALAFDSTASQTDRIQLAQADVRMKVESGDKNKSVVHKNVVRKKIVVRRGGEARRAWAHSRHHDMTTRRHGVTKKVVIKQKPGRTVIKKKIERS
jgi:hypothetical protein